MLPSLIEMIAQRETEMFEHIVPGTDRWVRSITTPFDDGFIATAQDIADHKNQSRAIEEQAVLFNGVLSSLQNGLSIYRILRDEAGRLKDLEYLKVADSVLRDTGMSRGELLGKSILAIYPGIEKPTIGLLTQKLPIPVSTARLRRTLHLPAWTTTSSIG